jgi:uncharacterized protein CbrC (UPF0167 family)
MEMHRTPGYASLQREYWPYHCGEFMAFVGHWQQEDFNRFAGGDGLAWMREHMSEGDRDWAEEMWEWLPGSIGWSYVHHCLRCGAFRVFIDSD